MVIWMICHIYENALERGKVSEIILKTVYKKQASPLHFFFINKLKKE